MERIVWMLSDNIIHRSLHYYIPLDCATVLLIKR